MPALALQSPSLVQQKVYNALKGTNDPSSRHRLWWAAAREFFIQWAASGGNANLQFVPYEETEADAAGGTSLINEWCQIYMFYVKKTGSATTANTTKVYADATDDTTTTDQRLSLITSADSQEAMQIYPTGFDMADGVVITQHTTIEGSTDGSDGGSGFLVVGAA